MGGEGGVFGPPRISDPRTAYHTMRIPLLPHFGVWATKGLWGMLDLVGPTTHMHGIVLAVLTMPPIASRGGKDVQVLKRPTRQSSRAEFKHIVKDLFGDCTVTHGAREPVGHAWQLKFINRCDLQASRTPAMLHCACSGPPATPPNPCLPFLFDSVDNVNPLTSPRLTKRTGEVHELPLASHQQIQHSNSCCSARSCMLFVTFTAFDASLRTLLACWV